MTPDTDDPEAASDELTIALTPGQIGAILAFVVVLIVWIRARRRRTAE